MEKRLAGAKVINIRRRRPAHAFVDVTGIVQPVAKTRMRFQSRSVRQINCVRCNIVNGGPAIVAGRRAGCQSSRSANNSIFRSRIGKHWPRNFGRVRRAKKLLEKRTVVGDRGRGNGPRVLRRSPAAAGGQWAPAFERCEFGGTRNGQRHVRAELDPSRRRRDVFLVRDCGGGRLSNGVESQVKRKVFRKRNLRGARYGSRVEQTAIGI